MAASNLVEHGCVCFLDAKTLRARHSGLLVKSVIPNVIRLQYTD